jgi:hypothetical protein
MVDAVRPENISHYWINSYSGKRLLVGTGENILSNQLRFIIYKVTKKGLRKIGEQTVDDASHARLYKSLILVHLYRAGQFSVAAYDTKLKKHLFSMPYVSNCVSYISEKGITASEQTSSGAKTITYYKRDELLSVHMLPAPVEGVYNTRYDNKGGLLYWIQTGPNPFHTNSPVSYLTVKGKKRPDNAELENAPHNWRCSNWDGRYLYVFDDDTKTLSGYILKKKAVKIGSIVSPHYDFPKFDKSRIYVFTAAPGGEGVVEYDRKLTQIQWFEPTDSGKISYIGNRVFLRTTEESHWPSHVTFTLRIFNKRKTLATHTYDQPY